MRTVSKLKKTLLLIFSLVLVVAGLATAAVYSQRATYTITDGDSAREVTTWKGTVAQVLKAADVEVGDADVVTPGLETPVADGTQIRIARASGYRVLVNGQPQQVFSTANSYQGILESANFRQVTLPLSRDGVLPLLKAAGKLTLVDGDTERALSLTGDDTLFPALDKAQVKLSDIDEVVLTSADGKLRLEVIRIFRGQVVEEIEVPFETEVRESAQLYTGQERILSEGAKGTTKVIYYRHIRGGKTLIDKEVSRETTVEAQPRVIEKGTAQRPRENVSAGTAPSRQNPASQAAPAPVPAPVSGDIWTALAQCESGGNPTTNTGNGYYGMYQFSLPTWQAVGGVGLPSEASAAEQTMRAQILQARAGWGQWPACARKLGLL